MEETPPDWDLPPENESSSTWDTGKPLNSTSSNVMHPSVDPSSSVPGYMRALRRSPSVSVENPAPGDYDVSEPFGVYCSSRMRNSVSHSMRSRDGWDKVVISKHHTQERKGIGTPGVGSYSTSPRRPFPKGSVVIKPSCSPRSPSLSSRSWLPLPSVAPSLKQPNLNIIGVSFPKARRPLDGSIQENHPPIQTAISSIPLVSATSRRAIPPPHLIPSHRKSSPVSGLYMPVFARHSRSMSFARSTRHSPRSLSPRFSPWSPGSIQGSSLSGGGAPKFSSPRTRRPRLDFRLMIN